jgi:uncharacterized membrane protein YozB (DUF420 family)
MQIILIYTTMLISHILLVIIDEDLGLGKLVLLI